jgi:hypothetical protein
MHALGSGDGCPPPWQSTIEWDFRLGGSLRQKSGPRLHRGGARAEESRRATGWMWDVGVAREVATGRRWSLMTRRGRGSLGLRMRPPITPFRDEGGLSCRGKPGQGGAFSGSIGMRPLRRLAPCRDNGAVPGGPSRRARFRGSRMMRKSSMASKNGFLDRERQEKRPRMPRGLSNSPPTTYGGLRASSPRGSLLQDGRDRERA